MEIKGSDIRKKYGSTEILKDVSMQVKDHQFVGIIGPNGSGKSTFLKCVYRILKPDNGAVYLDGQALLNMSVKESARKIAVVAQHNYYNFDFKIEEVVMMGRSPHKRNMERDNAEDYRIVNDCIEKVGMSRFKGRSFSTLSGGEQQRIILARALAQQTPCIVLDEPTNHLDTAGRKRLYDFVHRTSATVLVISHDRTLLNLLPAICELSRNGLACYGGNYDFYKEQKEVHRNALQQQLEEKEKALRPSPARPPVKWKNGKPDKTHEAKRLP